MGLLGCNFCNSQLPANKLKTICGTKLAKAIKLSARARLATIPNPKTGGTRLGRAIAKRIVSITVTVAIAIVPTPTATNASIPQPKFDNGLALTLAAKF